MNDWEREMLRRDQAILRQEREILRKVVDNDVSLTELRMGSFCAGFRSRDVSDYSKLGASLGYNTHVTRLMIYTDGIEAAFSNRDLVEGVKFNLSIKELKLSMSYQNEQNEQILLLLMDAVRGHTSMEILELLSNRIGSEGCEAIATLLKDQNCNLRRIDLTNNRINIEGATTLANSLIDNTTLREFRLWNNPVPYPSVKELFSELLCDKSSINNTYSSNHTLEMLYAPHYHQYKNDNLTKLLKMNQDANKSHVAIRKILTFHPHIDMEPFFEWDMEGERNLKALPYIISWFERAHKAVAGDEGGESYNIDERKLTAIYQFAKAMPVMFVPTSNDKGGEKKRKRSS